MGHSDDADFAQDRPRTWTDAFPGPTGLSDHDHIRCRVRLACMALLHISRLEQTTEDRRHNCRDCHVSVYRYCHTIECEDRMDRILHRTPEHFDLLQIQSETERPTIGWCVRLARGGLAVRTPTDVSADRSLHYGPRDT